MPCQYEDHYEFAQRVSREMSDLTRWLCACCETLATSVGLPGEPGLVEWWLEHQRRDAQRAREDAARTQQATLRTQALAKLTPEERAAL